MNRDIDCGNGLTRLADPEPEEWLPRKTQMMRSLDWYGADTWGYCYGSFWAERVCRLRDHRWLNLGLEPGGERHGKYQSSVYRCQGCGSQVSLGDRTPLPKRGEL